jgi:hypothetical protein
LRSGECTRFGQVDDSLPLEPFTSFFAGDDEQLRAKGAKRYVADREPASLHSERMNLAGLSGF